MNNLISKILKSIYDRTISTMKNIELTYCDYLTLGLGDTKSEGISMC